MGNMKRVAAAIVAGATLAQATVQGFDISSYQTSVNFASAYSAGARFVIIKATESTNYIDSEFNSHYTAATNAGFIRGGYHFAVPSDSDGATQAKYFLAHGGGWSNDGITLPGMLDLETNPYGSSACYGLTTSEMVTWVKAFGNYYESVTGRYPMIYTTASWWNTCTGSSTAFSDYPLVLAQWNTQITAYPASWTYQSFWQNADSYTYGGDSEIWNGSQDNLVKFATGG